MDRVKALEDQMKQVLGDLESERAARRGLEEKLETMTKETLPNLASTLDEINRRNTVAERTPKPDARMVESDGYEESSITKGTPTLKAFTGKKDLCPNCNHMKKPNLLDFNAHSGRWQCRQCAKSWYEEHLGQPYSKALEGYIKVSDKDIDPLKGLQAEVDKDAEVATLKKELGELKDLLLRGALAKNGG